MTREGRHVLFAAAATAAVLACASCQREQRDFRPAPPFGAAGRYYEEYEGNAYALSEGKRLFSYFNCVGCHAHGGGGMGPALMDEKWIYGGLPGQVHESIAEGRPEGMPAFKGKVPDYQIWQLTAYVRSMSGLAPQDAAPGREDNMKGPPPEQSRAPETPVTVRPDAETPP